jgi:hypothetical protein
MCISCIIKKIIKGIKNRNLLLEDLRLNKEFSKPEVSGLHEDYREKINQFYAPTPEKIIKEKNEAI